MRQDFGQLWDIFKSEQAGKVEFLQTSVLGPGHGPEQLEEESLGSGQLKGVHFVEPICSSSLEASDIRIGGDGGWKLRNKLINEHVSIHAIHACWY